MSDNLDHFEVLRKIKSKPNSSQRELASELGFSLGKLNYCLKSLKEKGLIKIKNFHKNPNKIGINISEHFALADGLVTTDYQGLKNSLPKNYQARIKDNIKI